MDIQVRPGLLTDVAKMDARARHADRVEFYLMSGKPFADTLAYSILGSSRVWAAGGDGDVDILWGVSRHPEAQHLGIPWLCASTKLEDNREGQIRFLLATKEYLPKVYAGYEGLGNYVHVKNDLSKNWLKWMGFELDEPKAYGPFGAPFHKFGWTRDSSVLLH